MSKEQTNGVNIIHDYKSIIRFYYACFYVLLYRGLSVTYGILYKS